MNTSFRFAGYAVRREFREGLRFYGSLPPKDAKAHAPRINSRTGRPVPHSGGNISPYRMYVTCNLLYRVARPSYQAGYYSGCEWDESDPAVFMSKRKRRGGTKQAINRMYRRAFKQQIAGGLESPSEFQCPKTLHTLNISW